MTYKLNPELGKIVSPVILSFSNGEQRKYENGAHVAQECFNHKYLIKSLQANDNVVVLELVEQEAPNMNWSGEMATSFF